MSERFDVKANERGIVRLFSVDLSADQIPAFAEPDYDADADDPPWALKTALGATYLDSDFVELFPVSDLTGLGLPGYMTEGLGIAEADIIPDRARLQAIDGHILIVVSSAFGGFETTLTPRAPLKWIGTYVEQTAPVKFEPLPSEAAKGEVNTAAKSHPSDAAMSGRVAMIALLVLFALVALMVVIAA